MLRYAINTSTLASKYMLKQNHAKLHHQIKNLTTKTAVRENVFSQSKIFTPGTVYHGFMCMDIQEIKEFNMTAILFKHEKSKTEYLHVQRDDPNNLFSINFRTTPFNSTGLPHILEHTVLCGSKKYPVRDPFFKMLNRSLATFMNAMTGPDYTFYPFSSQNEADYRNLQAIYLDAVFQPNLNQLDFLQEGWRLENSDLKNPKSDITFKGVVFNEMKGVFSENGAIFGEEFLNTILPDHTYGFVSGGDPLHIPNLTVKDLKDFHQKYYHPSNARIFSYGNFPVERNLEICDRLYLNDCVGIDSAYSRVPSQPRWKSPVEKNIKCRFDKMGAPIENQNQIAIGYLMSDITNVYETFVLQFLSQLMVMGPNSPFYKSLIEPNISGGYNSVTGYDPQMKDTLFVIGLQDLEVNKFEKVKEIMDQTLHNVIKEGFTRTHIDSVLHGIELGIKHQSTKFGLNLLFNLTPLWNHEGSVVEAMQIGNCLDRFKINLKNPKYLQDMVKHYFLANNHKLTLTMVPDELYEENIAKKENELLKTKISNMTDLDKTKVYEQGLQLAEAQKIQQNIDILPCLTLNDIPKDVMKVDLTNKTLNAIPVQVCRANTNDVTYFRGILNMSEIPNDLKLFLPLFNATATKMETKNYSYREFDELINLNTGGLSISTHVANSIGDPFQYEQGVLLSSHCLDRNLEGMLSIWGEFFKKPNFRDTDRFKMLLDNYVSNLTTGVADSGHLYAMQSANSLVLGSSLLKENLSGMKHIEFIKGKMKSETTESMLEKMSTISDLLLDRSRLRIAINLSKMKIGKILPHFEQFCFGLPIVKSTENSKRNLDMENSFQKSINGLHYKNNFSVNYCAKSILTVPFRHVDYAKLRVLAKFLSSKYLHPIIREKNGAYGGGARISNDGIFGFFSYRDPNARITLDVFDDTDSWLKNCPNTILDDQAIFEAKLGILQQLDAPVAEYNKGLDEFLCGLDSEFLQNHRNNVLQVTKEDIVEVCEKYLSKERQDNHVIGKCVIGPGEANESGRVLSKTGEKWNTVEPDFEE
ncbi:presequence protease, mitochondrial [Arctopsyche grandis]|uniref:presequence protease, mitochondrial n=1 Tax=Arctopsyche grandis TaxID=121162 RepID=UPI00406DA3BE